VQHRIVLKGIANGLRLPLLALVGLALVTHGASAQTRVGTARSDLQVNLQAIVNAGVPGATAYVRTRRSVWVGSAGFARLRPRVRMRPNFHMRIASITKTFVATVILQLVSEGKLGLDDSVEKWVPQLPNARAITVRELLNHSSGLQSDEETQSALAAKVWTPQELLQVGASKPPLFPPGTGYSYANTNYTALGLIVEAITGSSLGTQLRARIFDPLKLRGTSFSMTRIGLPKPYAHGYDTRAGGRKDVTLRNASAGWASGGVVSTAADVGRFFTALFSGRLVAPSLLAQMEQGIETRDTEGGPDLSGLGLEGQQFACGRGWGHYANLYGFSARQWPPRTDLTSSCY
jgi:D-alanyl-D-alanine carboxypeptidase